MAASLGRLKVLGACLLDMSLVHVMVSFVAGSMMVVRKLRKTSTTKTRSTSISKTHRAPWGWMLNPESAKERWWVTNHKDIINRIL